MSETPDPFGELPDELRRMLDQMGGPAAFAQAQQFFAQASAGPVNWELAQQAALQLAADGDRAPTADERSRIQEALGIAEHWLDETSLPAPPDAGRLAVASRQEWVNAALQAMRPLVEPVAEATTAAMSSLAQDQLRELGEGDLRGAMEGMPGIEGLGDLGPLEEMFKNLNPQMLGEMLKPAAAFMTGLNVGQVVGQLAGQLLGQYDLGIPTAGVGVAMLLSVNIEDVFGGWQLDETEIAVALALHEAAHRRLFHAVPWLEGHVHGLVQEFADRLEINAEQLHRLSQDLMRDVDPDDPESLQAALSRAGEIRLEPTPAQERILERLQGVVCLVGAWARLEVDRVARDRLPNLARIEEVLRRRRATAGDGEQLMAQLLGLDLKPDDERVGDRFVRAVEEARGQEGLRRALAHPENLPDADELADPSVWLVRMASGEDIPDDPSSLFAGLGDAPVEGSADERQHEHRQDDATDDDGDEPTNGSDDDPEDGTT